MQTSTPIRRKILQQVVSVANSATKLPTTPMNGRRTIIVQNLGNVAVYLGSSTVTATGATRGIVLGTQYASLQLDLGSAIDLYGIVATGTCEVAVFEAD